MAVKRIVANIQSENIELAAAFYADIFGLQLVMDQGWVQTFASSRMAAPQITIASEGGSGTPVPDISIEVDNFEEIYQRVVTKDLPIEYGPISEPWGVRRFYIRDPFGKLLNVLTHI